MYIYPLALHSPLTFPSPTWTPDMGPEEIVDMELTPPLLLTSGGHHRRPVHLGNIRNSPPFPSSTGIRGGHWNTYDWQVGGTHPTEMLSCVRLSLFLWGFNVHTPPKINEHLDFSVLDVSVCFHQLSFFFHIKIFWYWKCSPFSIQIQWQYIQ